MGFDYIMKVPLLLSCCDFFFAFGYRLSFLVGLGLFSVVVQQLVVILVFSWEEVSSSPSTPPSCLDDFFSVKPEHQYLEMTNIPDFPSPFLLLCLFWLRPCSSGKDPVYIDLCVGPHLDSVTTESAEFPAAAQPPSLIFSIFFFLSLFYLFPLSSLLPSFCWLWALFVLLKIRLIEIFLVFLR